MKDVSNIYVVHVWNDGSEPIAIFFDSAWSATAVKQYCILSGLFSKAEVCELKKIFQDATEAVQAIRKEVNMKKSSVERNKPPLGVKPTFIAGRERIKELADAISRYSEWFSDTDVSIDLVAKWAKEIVMQCDIIKLNKDATEVSDQCTTK